MKSITDHWRKQRILGMERLGNQTALPPMSWDGTLTLQIAPECHRPGRQVVSGRHWASYSFWPSDRNMYKVGSETANGPVIPQASLSSFTIRIREPEESFPAQNRDPMVLSADMAPLRGQEYDTKEPADNTHFLLLAASPNYQKRPGHHDQKQGTMSTLATP